MLRPPLSISPFTLRCGFLLALLACGTAGAAPIERQSGAHTHGSATMDVTVEGNNLSIHLEAPALNFVGFEHAPRNNAEQAALDRALQTLRAPGAWLTPNDAARCTLAFVGANADGLAKPGAHADISADYRYACRAPDQLNALDVRLIERFPGTHDVRVNIALPGGQTYDKLTQPHATAHLVLLAQ